MQKVTKQEIHEATEELQNALIESYEADKAETNVKLRKIRAHKRLALARDTIRSLTFN